MSVYQEKLDRMHRQSGSGLYCPACKAMVQRRTKHDGGTITLDAHPTEEGTWLIDGAQYAYRSESPMPGYKAHACGEE